MLYAPLELVVTRAGYVDAEVGSRLEGRLAAGECSERAGCGEVSAVRADSGTLLPEPVPCSRSLSTVLLKPSPPGREP